MEHCETLLTSNDWSYNVSYSQRLTSILKRPHLQGWTKTQVWICLMWDFFKVGEEACQVCHWTISSSLLPLKDAMVISGYSLLSYFFVFVQVHWPVVSWLVTEYRCVLSNCPAASAMYYSFLRLPGGLWHEFWYVFKKSLEKIPTNPYWLRYISTLST